jgi:stearoyl-CoA desaturase (delta-9 desaturase)
MVVFVLVVWHVTLLATTIYLHRAMAHRAVELHPVLSHFFRAWLWLTTGMVTVEWMAVHRKHHAKVETEDDPHSPVTHGLNEVLWRGAELYQAECENPQTIDKFGFGAPDDWLERNLYSRHKNAGLVLLFLLLCLLFGVAAITMTALILLCIPLLAAGVINGLGHSVGYRNYECDDAATNIVPIGLIIAGEELHNNHHAYPGSAKFSIRPWEIDVGWMYLRIFSAFGLARIVRVAPRPVIKPTEDRAVDLETVKAVISSRLHVMEHYARKVVLPTHKLERQRATTARERKTLAVRRELIAGDFMLDAAARERLGLALRESDTLRIVIEYRNQLQAIWQIAGASHEKLQEALQDWCNRAELSGIRALEEFSWRLRGYSLKSAAI